MTQDSLALSARARPPRARWPPPPSASPETNDPAQPNVELAQDRARGRRTDPSTILRTLFAGQESGAIARRPRILMAAGDRRGADRPGAPVLRPSPSTPGRSAPGTWRRTGPGSGSRVFRG